MKVGLIGLGVMGRNHYRVLKSMPGIELVAVCDPRLTEEFPERSYESLEKMLDEEVLEAAIVCVPTSSHLAVGSEVIRRKIPVLIEKPVASTSEEAQKLMQLAAENETLTAVGHVERFNPVVRSLMSELAGKEIYSINITRIGPFPPRINDVGVLVDLSVHDIDLVRCLTNGVGLLESRVYKSTKRIGSREDNAVVTMLLANDVVASITTNWLTPFKKRTIEVATDKAFYTADLMTQELTEYSEYALNNSFLVRKCNVPRGEPLLGELQAFFRYVRTGERGDLASLEDGSYTLETIYRNRSQVAARAGTPRNPSAWASST